MDQGGGTARLAIMLILVWPWLRSTRKERERDEKTRRRGEGGEEGGATRPELLLTDKVRRTAAEGAR